MIAILLEEEEDLLCFLEKLFKRKKKGNHFHFGIELKPKEAHSMLQVAGKTDQYLRVKIAPKTGAGHPAPVDGTPVWAIVSGNGSVQNVSADGLTAEIWSPDTVTDPSGADVTVASVTADADVGAGVQEISDTVEFTVTNAIAESLGLAMIELKAKP